MPFTEDEKEIWDILGKVAGLYMKLEQTHPSHLTDFVNAIHKCQDVMGSRVLQRTYPEHWATYEKAPATGYWRAKDLTGNSE